MIELATTEDISQLVSLAFKAHKELELGNAKCEPSLDKLLKVMTNAVIGQMVLVERNKEKPQHIEGAMVLDLTQIWWSEDLVLNELFFYIKEDFRTFTLAREFLEHAKNYAIMENIPLVFDIYTQKDVKRKKKLLKYLGFRELGTSLVYN